MSLPLGSSIKGEVYSYRIEGVLGQGAFGITYLASTKMNGPLGDVTVQVALKEYFAKELDSRLADGTVSARTVDGIAYKYAKAFQRESQNLSKMKHPGIVNVLEAFEAKGTYYYSMEYLSGGSLDDKVKGAGIPEDEALSIVHHIGDALTYMHERKVMHLDLKPKNIMLKADGSPVIIDFGLSKQYDSAGEPESSSTIGLGTPGYAPLEQATQISSREFQTTLDIYALGATLYKMLTGNTPPHATEILNDGFPERELKDKLITENTIRAIEKAMSAMRKDRPQSVADFLELLAERKCTNSFSPLALQYGTTLLNGKYIIIGFLGISDYEITYLSKVTASKRIVVIKEFYAERTHTRVTSTGEVLNGDLIVGVHDHYLYNIFLQEARQVAEMNHPNIVKVYDVFYENGTVYYASEYLNGGSLEEIVSSKGPLTEKQAEYYIHQVSEALKCFHSQGKAFLNVEPAHVLVNKRGEAVLTNPASYKFEAELIFSNYNEEDYRIEGPAIYINQYHVCEYPSNYIYSPDIYSLGATLYYLLSGLVPPAWYIINKNGLERPQMISDRMWGVIEKSMQPNPQNRPQTIDDFLLLFEEDGISEVTINKNPKPKSKPSRKKTSSQDNSSTVNVEKTAYEVSVIEKIAQSSSKSALKSVLPLCTTNKLKDEWYNKAVNHGYFTHSQASKLMSLGQPSTPSGAKKENGDKSVWQIVLWSLLGLGALLRFLLHNVFN